MKSNYKKLGQYIRQVDVRNTEVSDASMGFETGVPVKLRSAEPQHEIFRHKLIFINNLKNCVNIAHQTFVIIFQQGNSYLISSAGSIWNVCKLSFSYDLVLGKICTNSICNRRDELFLNRNT